MNRYGEALLAALSFLAGCVAGANIAAAVAAARCGLA